MQFISSDDQGNKIDNHPKCEGNIMDTFCKHLKLFHYFAMIMVIKDKTMLLDIQLLVQQTFKF